MTAAMTGPVVIFPASYDSRSEFETPSRGYLSDVIVQLDDGSRYQLFFIDPVRLEQTLTDDMKEGRNYYAEPGLIVLPEVNTESIKLAVEGLWKDGYFQKIKSL
jgi:hypothetical protein